MDMTDKSLIYPTNVYLPAILKVLQQKYKLDSRNLDMWHKSCNPNQSSQTETLLKLPPYHSRGAAYCATPLHILHV